MNHFCYNKYDRISQHNTLHNSIVSRSLYLNEPHTHFPPHKSQLSDLLLQESPLPPDLQDISYHIILKTKNLEDIVNR